MKRNSDDNNDDMLPKKYKISHNGTISYEYEIKFDIDEVKCCICYNYMLKEIYRCVSSHHYICNECYYSHALQNNFSRKCPICRTNDGFVRSFFLEKQLKNMQIKCKNPGCPQNLYPWNLEIHQKKCYYQTINCPCCNNSVNGGIKGLLKHFDDKECKINWIELQLYNSFNKSKKVFELDFNNSSEVNDIEMAEVDETAEEAVEQNIGKMEVDEVETEEVGESYYVVDDTNDILIFLQNESHFYKVGVFSINEKYGEKKWLDLHYLISDFPLVYKVEHEEVEHEEPEIDDVETAEESEDNVPEDVEPEDVEPEDVEPEDVEPEDGVETDEDEMEIESVVDILFFLKHEKIDKCEYRLNLPIFNNLEDGPKFGYISQIPECESIKIFYDIIPSIWSPNNKIEICVTSKNIWYRAYIIKKVFDKFFIHYYGYSNDHNEWIHLTDIIDTKIYTVANYGTHTNRMPRYHLDDAPYL